MTKAKVPRDNLDFEVADPNEPEWLRVNATVNKFGLSRTHVFNKVADGTLEHRHIVKPGSVRGILLIRVASIRKYINSFSSKDTGVTA